MTDLSKLSFFSGVNYMKRSALTGTANLTLGAVGSTVSQVITHSLGYIPLIHVSFEPAGDGIIFPSEKINKLTNSSTSGSNPPDPYLAYWTTTTALTVQLINSTSPIATGTRNIYWEIYLDYGNV